MNSEGFMPTCIAVCIVLMVALVSQESYATSAQQLQRELSYGPSPEHRLDLATPVGSGFPTVIFVHGGSLVSGDKADEDYRNVCAPFVEAEVACANVNYRLAPTHPWPAHAEDVAAAVVWIAKTIAARGGDPSKLFLFGHSSGAMLVALVGTDQRFLARHGMDASDIRGVIPMGSIMWDVDLEQAISAVGRASVEPTLARNGISEIFESLNSYLDSWPIYHIRTGLPPFLFLIAEAEQEHPPVLMTNRKFVAEATALGNRADLIVLPGRTHMSAMRRFGEPGDHAFAVVRDFVWKLSDSGAR